MLGVAFKHRQLMMLGLDGSKQKILFIQLHITSY
jgi:hypothetical protein